MQVEISLLISIVLHDKTSDFRVVPESEVSWKKSVEGRLEREINSFQSAFHARRLVFIYLWPL